MSRFPYQFFDKYIVRTPTFSNKYFHEKFSEEKILDEDIKKIASDPVFQEAIYLASPYLYSEMIQWLDGDKQLTVKEEQKLTQTLLKYYSRMSTRCTPFGLFSGAGIKKFGSENLGNHSAAEKIRDTRLDMHFLVALSKDLEKNPSIQKKLLFFPNNSIYRIGNTIRFIEYQYIDGKREYIISSAPFSEELGRILESTKEGKTISEMADLLTDDEITGEDALEFIQELVENQVLVSELEPNVSGDDFLNTIIHVLKRTEAIHEWEALKDIQGKLEELDKNIGNTVNRYSEIEDLIKKLDVSYEQKYLFQTDLYSTTGKNIDVQWKKEIRKGLQFLNTLSQINKNTQLIKFKKAFSERFEYKEVPLAYALDTEIGIGYRQNISPKGVHPYLEDLSISADREKQSQTVTLNAAQIILNRKLQQCLWQNKLVMELTDEDFKDFESDWKDLPDTLSCMGDLITDQGKHKLFLKGGGGRSAAALLARFCSEKSEIRDFTKEITDKEKELNPDRILAEVIHLPEARIGNVIRRPLLRDYEIVYLAQSVLPQENQISVDDLYISVRNDEIILRSRKLNKAIKPYLTNAHNYASNSLPVYHFLCDLTQDKRSGLYFEWGGLKNLYSFLPRVEYQNIILSKAQWKVSDKMLEIVMSMTEDHDRFLPALAEWREKMKIPRWIQMVKLDNTLTLNLENLEMAQLFIQTVKTEKNVILEEFLYDENQSHTHEFIFSLYKNN